MDTITHALIGAASADAVFGRKLGRTAAIGGALAGIVPDFDMLASLGNSLSMLEWHRSFTHSLFLLPLLSAGAGVLLWRFLGKKQHFNLWYLLCFMAILLHIVLDLCTSWGTEALWPLRRERYAWDTMPIVDPIFTMPLIIWAVLRLFKKIRPYSTQIATAVFAWCFVYCLGGLYMNDRAQQIAQDNTEIPQQALKTRAIPQPGSIFLWNVISQYPDNSFTAQPISTLTGKPLCSGALFYSTDTPLTREILQTPAAKLLLRTSQGFMSLADLSILYNPNHPEKGVQFQDLRYIHYSNNGVPSLPFITLVTKNWAGNIEFRKSPNADRPTGLLLSGLKHIFTSIRPNAPPTIPPVDGVETPAEIH